MKNYRVMPVILNIGAVISTLILFFPIYLMVSSSLKPINEIYNMHLLPNIKTLTLQNYSEILTSMGFGLYMRNTVIVAVTVTVISLFFHTMAGFALAKLSFPGKNTVFILILCTLMIPFSVVMLPLFLLVRSMGLINTLPGIIIPAIPHAFGIFLFRQFMLGIPDELLEAAKIDGASFFKIYSRIVLPISTPILITITTAIFLGNWNSYIWPLLVAQGRETWVIQIAIANLRGQHIIEWNKVLAASSIASIPPIIVFSFLQKFLVEGIKMSGVKA